MSKYYPDIHKRFDQWFDECLMWDKAAYYMTYMPPTTVGDERAPEVIDVPEYPKNIDELRVKLKRKAYAGGLSNPRPKGRTRFNKIREK